MPRKLEGFGTWGEVFGLTETQRNVITVELSGEGKHPELNLTDQGLQSRQLRGPFSFLLPLPFLSKKNNSNHA